VVPGCHNAAGPRVFVFEGVGVKEMLESSAEAFEPNRGRLFGIALSQRGLSSVFALDE
jgi:hypothetical protein